MKLIRPVAAAWPVAQHYGENPAYYAAWNLAGHEGTDYGAKVIQEREP